MTDKALSAPTSFRLPADIGAALKRRAQESGEPLSVVLRRAALAFLGTCPTCGQQAPDERVCPTCGQQAPITGLPPGGSQ